MDQTSRNACKICFMEQNDSNKHVLRCMHWIWYKCCYNLYSNDCYQQMINNEQTKCPICREDFEGEDNPNDFIDDDVIPSNESTSQEIDIPYELRDIENRLDNSVRELKYSMSRDEYITLLQEQAVQLQSMDSYEDEYINEFAFDCKEQSESYPPQVMSRRLPPPPPPLPVATSQPQQREEDDDNDDDSDLGAKHTSRPLDNNRNINRSINRNRSNHYISRQYVPSPLSPIRNTRNHHLPMPENMQHPPPPIPQTAFLNNNNNNNNARVLGRGSHPLADKFDKEEFEKLKKKYKELEESKSQINLNLRNMFDELEKERDEKQKLMLSVSQKDSRISDLENTKKELHSSLNKITEEKFDLENRLNNMQRERDDYIQKLNSANEQIVVLKQENERLKERLKYYE